MIKTLANHRNTRDYLFLFIVCCIGFWQITFFHNIVKWDIVDINLPWRYFISECLKNGNLPLWNPFINCGFPQEADPMTWYPPSWIIGVIFGNSLASLQYEFIFHIFIGSIGFYKLAEHLRLRRLSRIIIGVSFMFSGLFISNAQHFGWVVSAAWFPFILYYFLKFSSSFDFKYGIGFILVLFFQLTGGYAGFFVITSYILLVVHIYCFILYINEKKALKYLLACTIVGATFLILSSVVIVSSLKVIPFLTRTNQLSVEYANSFALPFKALLSFIFPFATTVNKEFWGADLSLLNCYFGIIPLLFLIYALVVINKKEIKILFFIGLFLISVALAEVFPFRRWLYHLPLMQFFRFPTIFRFFGYFTFILIAGYGINHFLKESRQIKFLKAITYLFIGVFASVLIYNAFSVEYWKLKDLIQLDIKAFLNNASIKERLFLQALISTVLLIAFLFAVNKLKDKKRNLILVAIIAIDLIIATQLNIYQTVVSFKKPFSTQKTIRSLPKGFPEPDLNERIIDINNTSTQGIPTLWRNLNVFYKKTSYEGYSPYYFSSILKSQQENCFSSVIKNPLLFLADTINVDGIIDSLSVDTLSSEKIEIISFNPNKIELSVLTRKKQLLTYVQNYYPGWKAFINEEESDIIKSNYTFMSIWVSEGENNVTYRYRPTTIIAAFYISSICLGKLMLVILVSWIVGKRK